MAPITATQGLCQCGCGKETPIAKRTRPYCGHVKGQPTPFLRGHVPQRKRHGNTSQFWRSPTYHSWQGMKSRCLNENAANYDRYGGAGITIHEPWISSFETFLRDMGERPEGTTIDRINPFGHYTPDNCRWADPITQHNNTKAKAALPPMKVGNSRKSRNVGSKHGSAKLNEEKVLAMRQLRAQGYTYQALGDLFGVTASVAYLAATGKTWKHVA